MFADCLNVDEQNLGHSLRRPTVVEQQQRVHPAMNRARRMAAHHPEKVRAIFGGENPSAHASQRVRAKGIRKGPGANFLGVGVYPAPPAISSAFTRRGSW